VGAALAHPFDRFEGVGYIVVDQVSVAFAV
jgi:hypothetical protein